MRGLGNFQRSQMRRQESQITARFDEVRQALNALERAVSHGKPEAAHPKDREGNGRRAKSRTELSPIKLAYSVKEALELTGVGRTSLYAAIAARELRAIKHHKKTLILAEELRVGLESLPEVTRAPRE